MFVFSLGENRLSRSAKVGYVVAMKSKHPMQRWFAIIALLVLVSMILSMFAYGY